MNRTESAALLTLMAAADRRTLGDTDVLFWAEQLHDVNFTDARAAVMAHYRVSSDYLMPQQVRDGVRRLRAARLDGVDIMVPVHDPDDVAGWLEERRRLIRDVADGAVTPKPLEPFRPLPVVKPGMRSLGQSLAELPTR